MTFVSPAARAAADPAVVIGMAAIVRLAYEGGDLSPLLNSLVARVTADPDDAAALMDLSVILLATGQRDKGLELQAAALELRRDYRRPAKQAGGVKVLAVMTAGDFMANTPIDFLLEDSDIDLRLVYVDADSQTIEAPEHDVVFVAIGESVPNFPVLQRLEGLLRGWPKPVVNGVVERIAALSRDGVCATFADVPAILSPVTVRADRATLTRLAGDGAALPTIVPGAAFPIIARPIGSHAGHGLEKLDDAAAVGAYLAGHADPDFYLAPFVDYRAADGLFRKQRIAFIDGQPFACHFATSEHWMVHYLSAGMTERPERRAEEAAWMATFDADFAARHADAFKALHKGVGLDYFGIDCAEMPDGRLLLFEADVAIIVHALDPENTFPYKKPAMRKLFDAFQAALRDRVAA
ncbi:MAG: hypothetical protein JWP92_65 [Caulobacter sp.]|nr:hypothetical protein [Caulobacter sp.]